MDYYKEIKNKLIDNEIYERVKDYSKERNRLNTYYEVGRLLSEAGKHYGEGIIKEYSVKLTSELGKGYTSTSLKRYRQFYTIIQKGATLSHYLTWSHYSELLPINDINVLNYYIFLTINNHLSIRQLRILIKSKEYERLSEEAKEKIINNKNLDLIDNIPEPIIIKSDKDIISEKVLQRVILEDISSFMKTLGSSFSFIDNEYKIKIGNQYNYIDLLLFNIEYNCYVVVELKVTGLKKEHIGQVEVYMNYIDKYIKKINHDKTIGIIIVRRNNKYIIEYCSDKRIISREYKIDFT